MKTIIRTLILFLAIGLVFTSCKKNEEENPQDEMNINLKDDPGYTYTSETLPAGTAVLIGVEAETEKAQDPIIKFNITEAINGGEGSTVYSEDLDSTDFEYDYHYTLDSISGTVHKFTFTITNRDGINKQTSIELMVE
jgi:hypothetical protein